MLATDLQPEARRDALAPTAGLDRKPAVRGVTLELDGELCILACEADADAPAVLLRLLAAGGELGQLLAAEAMQALRECLARPRLPDPAELPAALVCTPVADGPWATVWLAFGRLWKAPAAGAGRTVWRVEISDATAGHVQAELQRVQAQSLEMLGGAIALVDALPKLRPMLWVSRALQSLCGYDEPQLVGRTLRFLTGMQAAAADLTKALEDRGSATATLFLRRPDGKGWWAQVSLAPLPWEAPDAVRLMMCRFTDVTEQRELVNQLAAQRAMLEAVNHDNPNGLLAFDADGVAYLQNHAFKRLTGLYAVGMPRRRLLAALAERFAVRPERLLSALESEGCIEVRDGSHAGARMVEIRSSRGDDHGLPRLLVLRDATDEHRLQSLQREFLSTAAHEIRTPMAAIQGFSSLLLTENMPEDLRLELTGRIQRQSQRLGQMINDLLDLNRIESQAHDAAPLEVMPLQPVIEEVMASLAVGPAAQRLRCGGPGLQLDVQSRRMDLVRILTNLVGNALKYSQDLVQITATRDADDPKVVHIEVEDRGPGMTPQVQAQVFSRFFRADPDSPVVGTGLGLSIAQALAARIDATIALRSQPGVGSVFTLKLPLALHERERRTARGRQALA